MATKSPAEENSERKRISLPKADESVLTWWDSQKDPGLSVRLLIRNEIERNGFTDAAYRPVAQLPRRGRPPGVGNESSDAADSAEDAADADSVDYLVEPVAPARARAVQTVQPAPPVKSAVVERTLVPAHAAAPAEPVLAGGFSSIDALMNG